MLTFNKSLLFLFLICSSIIELQAQSCDLVLSGTIIESISGKPVPFASVYLLEAEKGQATDSLGKFSFSGICSGEQHISINHISYQTRHLTLLITKDTSITQGLQANGRMLKEAAIVGIGEAGTQANQALNQEQISEAGEKDLATQLESLSGVSSIKNGSGISKPVIHGLYGNRLSILNNGVTQIGQQWGIDHAPEIDPLVASSIKVIQGVGALEYQGNSLGSVILIEPGRIKDAKGIQGGLRYHFQSNGRGNGLNLNLSKKSKALAWRIVGTLNKRGDQKTPQYFLNNTGKEEAHAAIQLEKEWNKKWFSSLYISTFNAEIGVLRGSHIGNLSDLEAALQREVPFFTEDSFSYEYESPYQRVNHHLAKFRTQWEISEQQSIEVTLAAQYNLRKEFDVRRSGRSEIPALSIEQFSGFGELKYQNQLSRKWKVKSGVQLNRTDNANLPETGVLPLIPDYISQELGYYLTFNKVLAKTQFEFGGRTDFENRNVASISSSIPREVIRYNRQFQNLGAMAGVVQQVGEKWELALNSGYAVRNPEVNELYSNGLHQGVSGIEEGDVNLTSERSLKTTLSFKGRIGKKTSVQATFYHQLIEDFIYLNPQDEFRLTIRGAFPVFKYEQTNARLLGFDLSGTIKASEKLALLLQYSFLHGEDQSNSIPLVNMAGNTASAELKVNLGELWKIEKLNFRASGRYAFEQRNLLASQDFVAPPEGYFLLGAGIAGSIKMKQHSIGLSLKGENILNERFRDYLNRQRYFADGLGFNLILGIHFTF